METSTVVKRKSSTNIDSGSYWSGKSRSMMKWATDIETRRAIYIGSLNRDQNGLLCRCICPGCGGILQAVKAGIIDNQHSDHRSLAQHFRHHSGQQKNSCKTSVAERAALQLFIEQNEIEIPAPTARRTIYGASGTPYEGIATGNIFRSSIHRKTLINETSALITLDNGRQILVCLDGNQFIDDAGQANAVITIKVDDPEVALWSPDEILTKARLPGTWICLKKHWEDSQLNIQAELQATQEAAKYFDIDTIDVDLPSSLNTKQRSECLLHWKIKSILSEAKTLKTPAINIEYKDIMPNGQYRSEFIPIPEMSLQLEKIRYEVPMEGFKPDIFCTATDLSGQFGTFELIIEVAVTHRVDEFKLNKIANRKITCLELDTSLFGHQGKISIDTLRSQVLFEPSCKKWLYIQFIDNEINKAKSRLHEYARQIKITANQNEIIRQKQQAKFEWFLQLTDEDAALEYLTALRHTWKEEITPLTTSNNMTWTHQELYHLLIDRNIAELTHESICGKYGILRLISAIKTTSINNNELPYKKIISKITDQRWLYFIMLVIDYYKPSMGIDNTNLFKADRTLINTNIDAGLTGYARPSKYDKAIRLSFPELSNTLTEEKGTLIYEQRTQKIIADDLLAKLNTEKENLIRTKQQEQETMKWKENNKKNTNVQSSIEMLAYQMNWRPNGNHPKILSDAIKYAAIQRLRGEFVEQIIKSAWSAIEEGKPFNSWLKEQNPQSDEQINSISNILCNASLLKSNNQKQATSAKNDRPQNHQ